MFRNFTNIFYPMKPIFIPESELIINNEGAVYHLNLRPDELSDTIITVGDPDRVAKVSAHFDTIEVIKQHREFVTHTGYIGSKRLSVVSTGIGPDNIDIVLNELDALVNVDFSSRTLKDSKKHLNIIRLGTSGALQADIDIDSYVISAHAIGLDNLMHFYDMKTLHEEQRILQEFNIHTGLEHSIINPYIVEGGISLLNKFTEGFHHGITVTCPGFYAPQGRQIRMPLNFPHLIDSLSTFAFNHHRVTNFEMETSAIYGLSKIMGHNALSISTIVANRIHKTFSKDGEAAVNKMIIKSLEIISKL